MKMQIINPDQMTVTETSVDLEDYRAIQDAIGGHSYEPFHVAGGIMLFIDATARIRPSRPARFLLPSRKDARGEPMSIFGTALLVQKGHRPPPEIVFPKEHRVTSLDKNWRTLGCFVKSSVGSEHDDLNFHAILSDERFVAATRVVLATFEDQVLNVCPSEGICPMLELEIADAHIGAALDLYEEVLADLGYSDEREEEGEEEGNDEEFELPSGWAVLADPFQTEQDGMHRVLGLRAAAAI